jgi:nucleoside-diphosphate-sugar epimerase
MAILVTGAPGWLGTELVRELDDRYPDTEIRCLVLQGEDTTPLSSFDVDLYPGDVRDPESLHAAYEGGVETVYHCAGIIHPPLTKASLFYDINTDGTETMLSVGADHGVDHFVYISSNAAQGFNDDTADLMTEDMPCEPESNYGKSKYRAEEHVRRYGRDHDLSYTIVRPCWYYGPRQPERMATLMQMIADGSPIVFGDGTNLRSMTYIPALVAALCTIRERADTAANETYWIADETPYTTDHIYETIADCLGVADLSPRYIPKPLSRLCEIADIALGKVGLYEQHLHVAGEMSRHIACDPSKAMADLEYDPPSALRPGMERSVEWALEHGQV